MPPFQNCLKTPGQLPDETPVFVKELAAAADVSPATILRRIHLWESKPADPRAIPYLRTFGRPYRIARRVALRILSEGSVA